MKHILTLIVALVCTASLSQAQCLSDQIMGKKWVCVGKETNGEKVLFEKAYFFLTLENDNRFRKVSYEDGEASYTLEGRYRIDDCHIMLSSEPRSVAEGVTRRVEEYEITFNNDHYMTLTVSINGVLTRTYYCVYAGKPDRYRYNGSSRR